MDIFKFGENTLTLKLKKTMLVIDDASVYKIENIQQKFKNCGKKISLIPGSLIGYLQPLGVEINKHFKDELRKKYTEYLLEQK